MEKAIKFEVREIDAWMDEEGWYYNQTFHMGEFQTKAKNEKRAFMDYLRNKHGIHFKLNRTLIVDDGEVMEVIDRKTKEPIICAIPSYN